ncbi:hypothetical protein BOTCAL_0055g00060 [Botryotinia calthae]|uniref:Uncharacterized protein n=1 Tax=Botryotinia calthae TaxID=38488 RepID=A0A4Y8DCY3_9HELO|nr:hypothetical protein BOTCAL_0055g00060 [Botryotinia calthae]
MVPGRGGDDLTGLPLVFPKSAAFLKLLDLREVKPKGFGRENRDGNYESSASSEQLETWKESHADNLNVSKMSGLQPWLLEYIYKWTNNLSEHVLVFRMDKGASLIDSHGFETFALFVLNQLIQHLSNVETIYITAMNRAFQFVPPVGLPLTARYFQNLRTVYISEGPSTVPYTSFLLEFCDLPNVKSIYTINLVSRDWDQQRWSGRSREKSPSEPRIVKHSAITDISLDRSYVDPPEVFQMISTLKKLERFRWTYKYFLSNSNPPETLDWISERIREMLSPHEESLNELDLRFLDRTCSRPTPNWFLESKRTERPLFLGYLSDFQAMISLTIDPVVLSGRSKGEAIKHRMENLLPQSLAYLGLVYELGHIHELYPGPHILRKQTWSDEVISFANTSPLSMKFLTKIELIATSLMLSPDNYREERDQILEPAKQTFQKKGIECSITDIDPANGFQDFRTVGKDG